jgi:alpha-beta hydrolase superfamily lysophospholipase
MDLPGHGRSDGEKGDLDFETCLKSIDQIVRELKKRSSKVFLFAHSMGSTFALWYARSSNLVDGLILMAPYVRIGGMKRSDAEPSPLAFVILLLGRLIAPSKKVDITKALPNYVRIGGGEVAHMMQDPDLNFKYSYRYLIDIVTRRNSRIAELSDVNIPVLILHGLKDRNVYPKVSEEFFKLLHTRNKEIKMFDCDHWFYDAIFYKQDSKYAEEERMKFISSIAGWLGSLKSS